MIDPRTKGERVILIVTGCTSVFAVSVVWHLIETYVR